MVMINNCFITFETDSKEDSVFLRDQLHSKFKGNKAYEDNDVTVCEISDYEIVNELEITNAEGVIVTVSNKAILNLDMSILTLDECLSEIKNQVEEK